MSSKLQDVQMCVGQGYVGASTVSSQARGAAARVLEANPRAAYIHCALHCLNLVLVASCKLPVVPDLHATVNAAENFLKTGEKL